MSLVFPSPLVNFGGLATGRSGPAIGSAFSVAALPTDPIGSFVLTLTNVVVGSAIQIKSASGVPLHNSTASSSTVVINLSVYAGGATNDLNNIKVKVRKASAAPYYQSYTTLMTAVVGGTSHYVNQLPDQR